MTCRRIDRLSRKSPKRPPEARESDKNTANTQRVRFFKLYFDFNVFSAENRRLFSIEFQLHTISRITLWLPVHKLNSHEQVSAYEVNMTILLNLMYLSLYINLYSFLFPLNISENHDSAGSKEKLT